MSDEEEEGMQPYYYILIIYFKIWIRTTAKIEKNTRNAAAEQGDENWGLNLTFKFKKYILKTFKAVKSVFF